MKNSISQSVVSIVEMRLEELLLLMELVALSVLSFLLKSLGGNSGRYYAFE